MGRLTTPLGLVVLAACTSFGVAEPKADDSDAGNSPGADAAVIPDGRLPFTCPANAIVCDDFERAQVEVSGAIPDLAGDAGLALEVVGDSRFLVATVGAAGRVADRDRFERAALLRPAIKVPRRFTVHFKVAVFKPSVVQQYFQFMDFSFPTSAGMTSLFLITGPTSQQNGALFVQYDPASARKTLLIDSLGITDGAPHDVLIALDLDALTLSLVVDGLERGTLDLKSPIDAEARMDIRTGISGAFGIDGAHVDVDELFVAPSSP